MEIVSGDRPDLFASWLDVCLTGLSPGIAREIRRWATALHDGGPRTQARSPHTARACLRAVLPALLAWSARYDHLREVTRDDVLGYIAGPHGHERRQAVTALRSLFTWAKKAGLIFRNPATRIRLGKRDRVIWQPLTGRAARRRGRRRGHPAGTPVPGPGRRARGQAGRDPGASAR